MQVEIVWCEQSLASGVCVREVLLTHPSPFLSPFKISINVFDDGKVTPTNFKQRLYEINQNFESKHQTFCSWLKCQEQ